MKEKLFDNFSDFIGGIAIFAGMCLIIVTLIDVIFPKDDSEEEEITFVG